MLASKVIARLSGHMLVVPYYHMVSDARVPHVSQLYRFRTTAEFVSDVEFFLRHFEPITLSDIVDVLNGKRSLKRPCFHLTFDDGFREMHDIVAPILVRAGVPATFFLTTATLDGGLLIHHNGLSVLLEEIEMRHGLSGADLARLESLLPRADYNGATLRERILSIGYGQDAVVRSVAEILDVDLDEYLRIRRPYLSTEEARRLLNQGFSLGAHSHEHPPYSRLPLAEQLRQTRTSLEIIKGRFGATPSAFAFPFSDFSVGAAFFSTVFSERLLDVSFGTRGLARHFHPRNIERLRMEKTSLPAARILARQFLRAMCFRVCQRRPQFASAAISARTA
jgi:peptidoglycan/xylan/chitin deacetylase (PgdA/CDA1 family)